MDELSVIDIVCIGTLIGAVLLALCILVLGLRRNYSSTRATHSQDSLGLQALENSSNEDSEGLERHVLEALPVFEYKSHDGDQCAVCLSEFGGTERAKLLPNCNHYFHKDCIDIWFRLHTSCPVCRTRVQPNSSSSFVDMEKVIHHQKEYRSINRHNPFLSDPEYSMQSRRLQFCSDEAYGTKDVNNGFVTRFIRCPPALKISKVVCIETLQGSD
ncbi:RING-H2 finger protein ATL74-like [Cryptomeria japonica]|uniref:RING-H2 finger protein ATL74-like n=1 Tax=Cryptomeria japonica TaxID=3369 RepID=UPI0027DA8F2A|nr:RING-H2 finger protein ATL74-like [Cryptomeria japonica]